MNITVYNNFSKRRNSTKRPSGGSGVNVALKEGTSHMHPEFILGSIANPWAINYCSWGDSYYYVNDIVAEANNYFRLICELDVLATFKTEIGNYTTLIARSSADNNLRVIDNIYPAKAQPTTIRTPYTPNVFTDNISRGTYLMATVGKAGNHFYLMNQTRFNSLCQWLFPALGMDYQQWAVMNIGQALAGGQDNILKNVVALKWMPVDYGVVSGYLTATTETYIGNWTMPHANSEALGDTNIPLLNLTMQFADRPDGGARGDWLYQAPFASYYIYFPPFGKIEIDSSYMKKANLTCSVTIAFNLISGNATLIVNVDYNRVGVYNVNLACDMSSGGTSYNLGGVATGIATAISAYAEGKKAGMVGGIASAVSSLVPSGSQIGGGVAGVPADIALPCATHACYYDPIDENNAEYGRPLAEVRQISTLSGYVQCAGASLSIAGHVEEMQELNSLLDSGIFYE